ncbi:hypothetical protein [Delftia acidovorans]
MSSPPPDADSPSADAYSGRHHGVNPRKIGSSIERHRASPEFSWEQHRRRRVHAFGRSLMTRKAVYLDLRFWIGLRDAARFETPGVMMSLLCALRGAVAAGQMFCPITDSTFLEMFKQADPQSRAATADLISELSLGATLLTYDMRVGTEIAHYVHAARTPEAVDPLRELVWSKPAYVMGFVDPVSMAFDPATSLAMRKAFFDHMWDDVTLIQVCDMLGDKFVDADPLRFRETTGLVNEQIRTHADSLKNMKTAYQHELVGVLDLFAGQLATILAPTLPPEAGPLPKEGTPERAEVDLQCLAFLVGAFGTEAGRKALRTLHINATLHAAVRWNKGQALKANDLFDFQHACAALAYCDAFFTEGPLCTLVSRPDLGLLEQFDCFVSADVAACLAYVEGVVRDTTSYDELKPT